MNLDDLAGVQRYSWAFRNLIGQDRDWTPIHKPRSVTASANVNPLDDLILVDSTSGNVTMTLETAVGCDGRRHAFKKTVAANSMIIDGNGSETIDGAATLTRTDQYGVVVVESDGTNWVVIASFNTLFGPFSLTDPGGDRILFWDDSAGKLEWLSMGNSVAITTTTLDTIQDIRTTASPQFTGIELGHASDTTLTRTAAGRAAIEGVGIVKGPASATDNAVARFDSTTGELVQNSAFVVDDSGQVTSFGGNIAFPATQAASAGANVLDDYEEGTFTPTIQGSSTAGTQTYSIQLGFYTKIGNVVFIEVIITMTAKDAATAGSLQIAGLPFASSNATNYRSSFAIGFQSSFDLNVAGGYYSMVCRIADNSSVLLLGEVGDNVAHAALAAADLADTSAIQLSGHYRV